ncbi:MAG: protein-glutamate O-methyltransferase CheR [Clostridiales bacterium]|nr:protein-glutamate O-methyltransferase CheR [Clostridiales bacterium]
MVQITDTEFRKISDYVKRNYGIELKNEKRALVTSRLHSILTEHGFTSFSQYFDYVINDKTGQAAIAMINKITTNHTYFMREPDHFTYLKDHVLPWVKSVAARERDVRIWSAGCATGQEPYTLAMILHDFFGPEISAWDTRILATDISLKALDTAKKGVYTDKDVEPLPPAWRLNYFDRIDKTTYAVKESIKNDVIFRRLNLMDAYFPFKRKFHVIFCRNVMIYFNNERKYELIRKFYDITEDGGYLFVGHAESLNRDQTKYKFIKPAIYRKE